MGDLAGAQIPLIDERFSAGGQERLAVRRERETLAVAGGPAELELRFASTGIEHYNRRRPFILSAASIRAVVLLLTDGNSSAVVRYCKARDGPGKGGKAPLVPAIPGQFQSGSL